MEEVLKGPHRLAEPVNEQKKKIWRLDFYLILISINHKSTFEWMKKSIGMEFMRTRLIFQGLIGVWLEVG